MGSSSSVPQAGSGTANTQPPSIPIMYPSLDVNRVNGANPILPFSNSPAARNSLGVCNTSSSGRNASPIDNVPFSLSANCGAGGSPIDEDYDVVETLTRIQQFVNNANLSEYSFMLENSILSESLFA